MENQEMKITPQDIIDKEFRVKFRGFDMAEVDAFLEEVAESFFKLAEENTLLHERILALQHELETGAGATVQGQEELPAELANLLEDLKQDTAAIGAGLTALKQDRPPFDALEKNLKAAVAAIRELADQTGQLERSDIPAELAATMTEFKQSASTMTAELAALKEERLAVGGLKTTLEEVIRAGKEAAAAMAPGQAEIPAELGKTLEEVKQGTAAIGTGLTALQQEVNTVSGIREEIKQELQELLAAHFEKLATTFTMPGPTPAPTPAKPGAAPQALKKPEKLLVAEIAEEPEGYAEKADLPDFRAGEEAEEEGELEFLTEDDILNVDKLRGIFQSVLDEGISDGHESREGADDEAADLLFLEDDFLEDEHEPEVTFSLEEHEVGSKPAAGKK